MKNRFSKIQKGSIRINDYQIRYMKPLYIVTVFLYDNAGFEIYSLENIFLSKSGAINNANRTIKKYTSDSTYKNKNFLLSIKVVGVFPNEQNKIYSDIKINT